MTAPDAVDAAWSDPKLANILYHDWEASTYDEKWSISYDERRTSPAPLLHRRGWSVASPYPRALRSAPEPASSYSTSNRPGCCPTVR